MNFQQLKAKYAQGTTAVSAKSSAVATKSTEIASKSWEATKAAAVSTSSYVKGISPATNRRVNAIATELNGQLNNQEKEIFKQRVLIEMLAQQAGVNLPTDELLEKYWEAEQELGAEEGPVHVDTMTQEPTKALASPAEELQVLKDKVDPDYTPEQRAFIEDALEEAKAEETEAEEVETEVIDAEPDDQPASKQGRRRLGRQQPLAE